MTTDCVKSQTPYICSQIDDILGKKMSDLPYYLKYHIIYKYKPRPEYINELKSLFEFINKYCQTCWTKTRKSMTPKIFYKEDVAFIINGSTFNSQKKISRRGKVMVEFDIRKSKWGRRIL